MELSHQKSTHNQRTILLFDEKDRHSKQGIRGTDKAHVEVLVNKFMESTQFRLREWIDRPQRSFSCLIDIDFQVVFSMWR